MLVTLTNSSSTESLNKPIEVNTQVDPLLTAGIVATGGAKENALPHPFDRVGVIAPSGSIARAMNPEDWRFYIFGTSHTAVNIWRQLVQASKLTLAFAQDTYRTDSEELFIAAV